MGECVCCEALQKCTVHEAEVRALGRLPACDGRLFNDQDSTKCIIYLELEPDVRPQMPRNPSMLLPQPIGGVLDVEDGPLLFAADAFVLEHSVSVSMIPAVL